MSFGFNPSVGPRMDRAQEDHRREARHGNHTDEIKRIAAEALSLLDSDQANGIKSRGKRSIEEVECAVPDESPSASKNSKLKPIPKVEKIPSFEGQVPPGYTGLEMRAFASGDVYEGQLRNGKLDDQGKITYAGGKVYEAQYPNDYVKKDYPNGLHYWGQFLDDKRHGSGNIYKDNRLVYTGGWNEDLPDGQGQFFGTGSSYKGEFKKGKYHGFGRINYPNDRFYEGQWAEGEFHGRGTLHEKDGSSFTGNWVKGQPDGQGIFTERRGKSFIGHMEKAGKHLEFIEDNIKN